MNDLQIFLLLSIPASILYTSMIFVIGYQRGFNDGIDLAKEMYEAKMKEVENAD